MRNRIRKTFAIVNEARHEKERADANKAAKLADAAEAAKLRLLSLPGLSQQESAAVVAVVHGINQAVMLRPALKRWGFPMSYEALGELMHDLEDISLVLKVDSLSGRYEPTLVAIALVHAAVCQ